MKKLKTGDRVRHEAGWLATVTQNKLNTVMVEGDDAANSGEYSAVVFELAGCEDPNCCHNPECPEAGNCGGKCVEGFMQKEEA